MNKSKCIHIGLCSIASNGKTTLAQQIEKELNIPYEGSFSRKIAEKYKVQLNKSDTNNQFDSNLLQAKLMECHYDFIYNKVVKQKSFVCDRTVYDVLAYSYCYYRNNDQISKETLDKCISKFLAVYKHYDIVFILPPIDDYKVIDDGSRSMDMNYHMETWKIIEMINFLYPSDKVYITKDNQNWDIRNKEVINKVKEIIKV